MSTRRNFLALVGMAPIAAPVAAKEAAAAMGLAGPLGGMAANIGTMCAPSPGLADDGSWARRALARMLSEEGKREIINDAKAYARNLDADLAAMRSVSPAFAYRLQCDRNEAQITRHRRESLLRDIAEASKRNLLG